MEYFKECFFYNVILDEEDENIILKASTNEIHQDLSYDWFCSMNPNLLRQSSFEAISRHKGT